MEYQTFGPTSFAVSRLCLGTMTFACGADEAASHAILDRFTAGGTFIDTSNVYGGGMETSSLGNGESKAIIGRWLRGQPRDRFIIATKVIGPMGSSPNDKGLSRHHILCAVEDSLRRLGTFYISFSFLAVLWPSLSIVAALAALVFARRPQINGIGPGLVAVFMGAFCSTTSRIRRRTSISPT